MTVPRKGLKADTFKDITTGRRLAPVHPGEVLRVEFLEPMGVTRYRLAKAIGVQQRRVDEICSGLRSVTADTAVRLGLALGVEPQFWLNLQTQHDLDVIHREHGDALAEAVQPLAA